MDTRDLPVPLYLNQQAVFDLLAVIEDGFSQLRAVKTSSSESEKGKDEVGGEIGVSNVFAFLGVKLKGGVSSESGSDRKREVSEERVFTPASLFAKLRAALIERGLLTDLDTVEHGALAPGQFVEFSGILRKNPVVAAMEGMIQLIETAQLFAEQPVDAPAAATRATRHAQRHQSHIQAPTNQPLSTLAGQMRRFLAVLTSSQSVDIVADVVGPFGGRAVLSVEMDYFSKRNPTEIVDGQFTVLGKVVKIVGYGSDDHINLLRKTSLSMVNDETIDQMFSGFATAQQQGIRLDEISTRVAGPAIQVLPISVYI